MTEDKGLFEKAYYDAQSAKRMQELAGIRKAPQDSSKVDRLLDKMEEGLQYLIDQIDNENRE